MKIEAYTLIEMLVVLALTGLVLTISWGVYSQFRLYSREYEMRHAQADALRLVDTGLRGDLAQADSVGFKTDSLVVYGKRHAKWWSQGNSLLRAETSHLDSFALSHPRLSFRRQHFSSHIILQMGDSTRSTRQFLYRIEHLPTAQKANQP